MKKSPKKFSIYKITIPISLLVLIGIFLYIFSYNKTMPLEDIYIKSTFPVEEQEKFKQQLQAFSWKKITSYTDAIDKARLYSYLWYPGKALLVYKDFEKISTWEYISVINNIWHLYKDICVVEDKFNRSYCYEAIKYYKILIDKYNDYNLYQDISKVYLKLWNKKRAIENYKLYKRATNGWDSRLEEQLWL